MKGFWEIKFDPDHYLRCLIQEH